MGILLFTIMRTLGLQTEQDKAIQKERDERERVLDEENEIWEVEHPKIISKCEFCGKKMISRLNHNMGSVDGRPFYYTHICSAKNGELGYFYQA